MGPSLHEEIDIRVVFENLDDYPAYDFYLKYGLANGNPYGAWHLTRVYPAAVTVLEGEGRRLTSVHLLAVPHGQTVPAPPPPPKWPPPPGNWLTDHPPDTLQAEWLPAERGVLMENDSGYLYRYTVSVGDGRLEVTCVGWKAPKGWATILHDVGPIRLLAMWAASSRLTASSWHWQSGRAGFGLLAAGRIGRPRRRPMVPELLGRRLVRYGHRVRYDDVFDPVPVYRGAGVGRRWSFHADEGTSASETSCCRRRPRSPSQRPAYERSMELRGPVKGVWQHCEVGGRAVDVREPASDAANPRFALIYLHSYGLESLRGRHRLHPPLRRAAPGLRLSARRPFLVGRSRLPRVRSGTHAGALPARHVLPFLPGALGLERHAVVGLLGISMGGQGALRLAFKHPDSFPSSPPSPRPSSTTSCTAGHAARRDVRQQGAVPAGHGADAHPPEPIIRRTSSSASIPTNATGIAATIGCTRSSTPWACRTRST